MILFPLLDEQRLPSLDASFGEYSSRTKASVLERDNCQEYEKRSFVWILVRVYLDSDRKGCSIDLLEM